MGNYKITIYNMDGTILKEYHFENVYVRKEDGCIKVMNKKGVYLLVIDSPKHHTVIAEFEEKTPL